MRLLHILTSLCFNVGSCIAFSYAKASAYTREHAYDKWEPLQMYDAVGELPSSL